MPGHGNRGAKSLFHIKWTRARCLSSAAAPTLHVTTGVAGRRPGALDCND